MKYFVLLLLLLPSPVTAQCKEAISTKDMQDGMDNEWKKSDADLNRVYQESLRRSSSPSKPPYLRKRNAPGSPIATPSAKPTTKCPQVAPPLL
jgi:hypothetical protein